MKIAYEAYVHVLSIPFKHNYVKRALKKKKNASINMFNERWLAFPVLRLNDRGLINTHIQTYGEVIRKH